MTMVAGGIAENVIPDLVTAQVNYRYPPGISAEHAAERLHALCDPHGELEITSNAPSGPVPLDNPLVDRLCAAGNLAREPKQAWTPVAEFGAAGIDAVNFGPGAPPHAHTRDERVAVADLVRAYAILDAFASA